MTAFNGPSVILCGMMLLTLAACGGDGGGPAPDTGGTGNGLPDPDGVSIAWGPRLGGSDLSAVSGAEDEFGVEVVGALLR